MIFRKLYEIIKENPMELTGGTLAIGGLGATAIEAMRSNSAVGTGEWIGLGITALGAALASLPSRFEMPPPLD